MTVAGLGLASTAGLLFFFGQFRQAALWALAAGACDLLDGELARQSGKGSTFGAFLDSTLDRIGEALLLAGIAGFYITHLVRLAEEPELRLEEAARGLVPWTWALAGWVTLAALVGSFMVSYTRARAEGLGLQCRVGWLERPERMALIVLPALFGVGRVMMVGLLLLTVLSWWTAGQRIRHVWRASAGSRRGR